VGRDSVSSQIFTCPYILCAGSDKRIRARMRIVALRDLMDFSFNGWINSGRSINIGKSFVKLQTTDL
jgi:hypothetical protein